MSVIILHRVGAPTLMSPGQIKTPGEKLEFDTVTERWFFPTGIPASYLAKGNADPQGITGSTLICFGPSDVEELPGGCAIATITWRGLLTSTGQSTESETYSVRETTYEAIAGIPGAGSGDKKGRLYDIVPGFSKRSIHTTKQQRPGLVNATGKINAPTGAPNINAQDQIAVFSAAETWNYPWGWIPVSWQQEEPLDGIFFVTAEYTYQFQKTFG